MISSPVRLFLKIFLVLMLLGHSTPEVSRADEAPSPNPWSGWYVALYEGQWIGGKDSTSLSGLTDYSALQDSFLLTANVGRQIGRPFESLYVDAEGQIGQHFGEQDHQEVVGVLVARWESFPWDHELDTSLSVGEGLSWASELPAKERGGDEGTARLLNYMLFEVAASPWEERRWEGFLRVHHRSGVFGTFGGVYGASNFIGLGVRYRK